MPSRDIVLKSSNAYKVSEYTRLFGDSKIRVEAGEDLKEVKGTIDEVIVYKAIEAGENVLVEDTTMIINGEEEVEIKWRWDNLKTGDQVRWFISLGVLMDGQVEVYKGHLDVAVDRSLGKAGVDGVVFEPFIVPLRDNPDGLSYTKLCQTIDKDIVDPRAIAVSKILSGNPDFVIDRAEVPAWTSEYQND